MNKQYDITVVGGGIIGLMFAAKLSAWVEDLEICVIQDKKPLLEWPAEEIPERVVALNRSSQNLFESLGLWDLVLQEASPYFRMEIVDKASNGIFHFDQKEVFEPDLGHIVTNRILQKVLWNHLSSNPQVDLKTEKLPTAIQVHGDFVELNLGEDVVRSKLLVGADGAASWVHQYLNFERYERDYGHCALIAWVRTEKPHHHTAIQYFSSDEVVAFLPLKNVHESSIVWSVPPEKADYLKKCAPSTFNILLAKAIDERLGKIEQVEKKNIFPLKMRHSKTYVKERIALIGDAIHTIHPLAGQGMNLGLADAGSLAQVIKEVHEKKRDIGSLASLRCYERARKGDNWRMTMAMDGIKYIFSNESLISLRKLGMNQLDQSLFLKKLFIQEALGK